MADRAFESGEAERRHEHGMAGSASLEHTAQVPQNRRTGRLILRSNASPSPAALVKMAQFGQEVLQASLYVLLRLAHAGYARSLAIKASPNRCNARSTQAQHRHGGV